MEEKLLSEQEKIAYERLPSAMAVCCLSDGKLKTLLFSDGMYSLLGGNGKVAFGAERIHPEEREGFLQELKSYAENDSLSFTGYWRVLRFDGESYQYVYAEGKKRAAEDGSTLVFLSCTDGTEKFLEEVTFSRLTILGFDVIGILNPETGMCRYFRIKKMNARSLYENVENYHDSITGDIERIILPEERAGVSEALKPKTIKMRLASADIYPFVYTMKSREGKIKKKLLQFSYLDEKKNTIFFCKSDITTQYENEQRQMNALRAAKLDADRANSEKSVFLSGMSHDLRTPLNGIIGFTYLALKEDGPKKIMDYLEKIRSSGELLLDLVNDTLELSRIESGKFALEKEEIGSHALAENVLTALEPSAELKKLRFEKDLSALPDEMIRIDRLKAQKIILNLVSNAIKYTPAGGLVSVSLKLLDLLKDGCNYCLQVKDSGIGMSAQFQKRMYEPFAQEKRPEALHVTGTGLGLSLVKRYVQFMGGQIEAESTEGKGTVFTVYLPVERAGAPKKNGGEKEKNEKNLSGRQVLLCEDNDMNAEIVKTILVDEGMQVTAAQNGKIGLELFRGAKPFTFAVILMDNRMPVMDGHTAAKEIRSLKREDAGTVPIIAMSADAFEEDIEEAKKAGMNDYITKPIDPEKLIRTIGKNLQ